LADNGDFEDGDSYPWQTQRTDPYSVYVTDQDYTQGSQSLNITAYSPTASAYCDVSCDYSYFAGWQSIAKGHYGREPGDLVFEFDWKYTDTLAGEEYAYFYLVCTNDTFSGNIFYWLGDNSGDFPGWIANTSYSTYMAHFLKAPDFNVKDTWNHFSVDFYDIMQTLNLGNVSAYYLGFSNHADGPFSKVQLLVDECKIIVQPTGDPSFENNFMWIDYDPIITWMTPYDDDYVNITSDAYTGNYAANLSSHGGYTNVYCRRNVFLPVDDNLYVDFMWRLDELTDTTQWAYSEINLRFDGGRDIHYVIGMNSFVTFVNTSFDVYYYVDGMNQIDVWTNLFRNLSNDVYTAFGVDNWNVTRIDLYCYAGNPDVATAIFDDLYFVRDNTGPTITNPQITPSAPEYGETVDVTVDVVDSTEIQYVQLLYKIGTGSWIPIMMTQEGNEYSATIPDTDYGTTVYYYFFAEDVYGNVDELGSVSDPYFYIVDDTVNPVLTVEAPLEINNITGIVRFNITEAYDLGSDIAAFEITIDSIVEYSSAIVPAYYEWNTTSIHNEVISVVFRLEDYAGNDVQINLMYTLNNPTPTPSPTDTGSFTSGFLSISLLVTTSIIIIVRRKKKV
jgi:hypothetical protein